MKVKQFLNFMLVAFDPFDPLQVVSRCQNPQIEQLQLVDSLLLVPSALMLKPQPKSAHVEHLTIFASPSQECLQNIPKMLFSFRLKRLFLGYPNEKIALSQDCRVRFNTQPSAD